VDIRQQTARRDASAATGRTDTGITAPPACLRNSNWAASPQLACFRLLGSFKIWSRISSATFDTLLPSGGKLPLTLYLLYPAFRLGGCGRTRHAARDLMEPTFVLGIGGGHQLQVVIEAGLGSVSMRMCNCCSIFARTCKKEHARLGSFGQGCP
jgi:hypothetical protein